MTNIFRVDLIIEFWPSLFINLFVLRLGKVDKTICDICIMGRTIADLSGSRYECWRLPRSAVIQQVGEVRRAHFSHHEAKATCARLLLYFLRGSVKYPTPNARSRIQVRRSTYVRLGFRRSESPPAFPASLSRSHVVSPFRRHFRSYYINLTLKRYAVLLDDRIF